MDPIFDRLGNLIRSFFQESDEPLHNNSSRSYTDPDMADAWSELDDFLKTGHSATGKKDSFTSPKMPPAILRADYETLKVPFGAPFSEVKKAYKKLIVQYHPDKNSASEDMISRATKHTQKINFAFQRIKKYEATGKV